MKAPAIVATCIAAAALAAPAAAGAHQAILGRTSFPCGPSGGGFDNSMPLKGIRVWARPKGGGPVAARDRTGKHGRFRLDLEPGRWVVHFQKIESAERPEPRRVHLRKHEFPHLDVSYNVSPPCL